MASAYNSMLMKQYRSLWQTCMHDRRNSLTACLLCTAGSVTTAWHSTAVNLNIGTRQRLCTFPSVASPTIAGTLVPFSETIKTLGVILDQNLTLNKHVSSLLHNIHYYTHALRHIRPALAESIAATLGASLVQSRLDYSNSIMYGISASNMQLQSAQNSLTRVVLPSLRHLSASERLYLHWLPVHYRIQFKIATLTYKTLATCQPSYLYNLLQVHQPSQALRSSTHKLLQVPYLSTDFGRRAFSYSAPATWNSIPTSIKKCSSLYSFKHHLKSHLIAQLINS